MQKSNRYAIKSHHSSHPCSVAHDAMGQLQHVGRGDLSVSFEASHSNTQMVDTIHIKGPLGSLSAEMLLPKGFDRKNGRCELVILMHGFLGSKKAAPLGFLARMLVKQGYAVLRFDFDGYGKSEGAQVSNTVPGMILDARAVWDYASALPYVHRIVLLGHSQGGVVAGMLAGRLEKAGTPPSALIQLAPASILKEYARQGPNPQSPIPNPQSPIPNPQSPFYNFCIKYLNNFNLI